MERKYTIYRLLETSSNESFLLEENEKQTLMSRDKLKEYLSAKYLQDSYNPENRNSLSINMAKENADIEIYLAKTVDDAMYIPHNVLEETSRITTIQNKQVYNMFNKAPMWTSLTIDSITKLDYEDNAISTPNIDALLLNLLENDAQLVTEYKIWLSQILFSPERKHPVAFIFIGAQGSGKSRLKEVVLSKLFGNNVFEIGNTQINSDYNEFMMRSQIVFANEVTTSENRYAIPSKLKQLVTDENIPVDKKYANTRYVKNFTNWNFASNENNPLKIDADDRRYYITKSKKISEEIINKLYLTIDTEIIKFAKQLYILYKNYPEYKFIPKLNETKKQLILMNKNSIETFVHLIKEDESLWKKIINHLELALDKKDTSHLKEINLSLSELYRIYRYVVKELGFNAFSYNKFIVEMKPYEFKANTIDLLKIKNNITN